MALEHMQLLNGWSRSQAEDAAYQAMRLWDQRSRHEWAIDYSWVTRVHGFRIEQHGLDRAEQTNVRILEEARLREEQQALSSQTPLGAALARMVRVTMG